MNNEIKLTKASQNFALKRGLSLSIDDEFVSVFPDDGGFCSDPMVVYRKSDKGTFSFVGSLLPENIKEELPATIFNVKQMHAVVDFLKTENAVSVFLG